jgi:hypothetical protein
LALPQVSCIYKTTYTQERSPDRSVGIATAQPGFNSGQRQDFFLLHSVETGSGVHPASYPMGAKDLSPRPRGKGVKLTSHLHLVPKYLMEETYLHSFIRTHGMVLN